MTRHETSWDSFSWRRLGLIGFAVVFAVAAYNYFKTQDQLKRQKAGEELTQEFEAESFAILRDASGPDELRDAVGSQGHFFFLSEEAWIAVRYSDSHNYHAFASSAVAVDSGGNWWVSHEHFCGRFNMFRKQLARVANAKDAEMREYEIHRLESYSQLNALQNSESLDAAHVMLRELGFRAASPP